MKILVLGASGMAGHVIAIYLLEQGHNVTAYSRHNLDWCNTILGDVTDKKALKRVIDNGGYDSVINAVGILNQNAERDKPSAVLVNSYIPHYLAFITKDTPTKLIHMSTDCVFSGRTGSYTEKSLRDGETFYDRTKALGELEDSKNLTFRNSIIGPDINEGGIGLFNWFMKQYGTIKGYTKAIWTGVSTITLARAMEYALRENLSGLYQLVNNATITKYTLLCLFNQYIRNDSLIVQPSDMVCTDKSLINTRRDFSFIIPSYEEMVVEIKDWIERHKLLYPHYR